MSSSEISYEKLEEVFQLFLQPDFNVVSTTSLDLLLTHIKDYVKNGDNKISQIVQNWIVTALGTWNENVKPGQNLVVFTVKLIGSISENEATFLHLQQNDVHNKVCTIFEFQKENLSASVKMAFTVMLTSLLEHQSGRDWITQTEAWKVIVRYAHQNHTMYVTKQSQKVISRLLILECNNQSLCKEIILAVTEPLVKATTDSEVNNQQPTLDKRHHFEQNNLLLTTIELLIEILEYTVFYDFANPIPEMFEELTSLESRVKTVFEVSISTPFVKSVPRLVKLLVFSKLRCSIKETENVICEKTYDQFTHGLYYHAMMLLSKNFILDFVVSMKLGYGYWKKLLKMRKLDIPRSYKYEDQTMALMILPLTTALKPKYMKEHYLFEEFINKLFDVTCTPVQRLAYNVRDVILKSDFPMESICTSTVNYMLEITDIMDRESAVIMFQVICHALKNFVTESAQNHKAGATNSSAKDNSNGNNSSGNASSTHKRHTQRYFLDGDPVNDKQTLLAALLNGLNVLTEKYKLKWQECVETICVLSIAQDILNHSGVDSKICILALKTCKLSIQNFMPPNLALLVDFDEHTKSIGPTLFKRIHDPNWEVQDSVLEILNTIACLSENKYPPYQCFLLENRFLQVAIDIVKGDNESYVRASALTFISTAVRINTIWEKLLCQSNLPDLAIKIVYTESEAIVRREAVVLIKQLYIYRKWQKPIVSSMSQAMTSAAVLDLHWEVKVNALEFWRYFIKSHLTDQGMLDGHFPNVTFSKEHRKIVSLDETEIKQRLNKALDELARQHCLGVLLVTLKDESDLEVAKTSANIIGELRRVLLEYKLDEPAQPSPSLKDAPMMDTNYIKRPTENSTSAAKDNSHEAVIDSIVDANDANLLGAIFRESARMDDENGMAEKSNGKQTLELVEAVTRSTFLGTILRFDLEGYIKERSEWLQNYMVSFNSVLEDILVISNQKDVNSMDCY